VIPFCFCTYVENPSFVLSTTNTFDDGASVVVVVVVGAAVVVVVVVGAAVVVVVVVGAAVVVVVVVGAAVVVVVVVGAAVVVVVVGASYPQLELFVSIKSV
jgi:hypothetical protein